MKNLINGALVFTALTMTAGAAFGQSLNAKIDFPFRVSGVTLPAGEYQAKLNYTNGGFMRIHVMNMETRQSVLANAMVPIAPVRNDDRPARLVFNCASDTCTLAEAWSNPAENGAAFPVRPAKTDRVAVVRLTRSAD